MLLFQAFVMVAITLAPGFARADLYGAAQAYDKKDFARSFQLYRELAKLGQADAQYNLAIMYVNGEGVARDNVAGYAWAAIARENGAGEGMQSIVDQLEPHMNERSRKKVEEIKGQFGNAALDERLLPKIFEGANYIDRPQKDQRKALRMAQVLGWETASQQGRLGAYEASKPWTGDLFAF